MFGRIDHVGVAVEDIDAALPLYREPCAWSSCTARRWRSWAWTPRCSTSATGTSSCIAPLGPETGVGKFLASRGPGLHHVAYAVDDIEQALDAVREAGLRLIDERARRGIRNSRVAFIHPSATGGVLTEIVQPAEDH